MFTLTCAIGMAHGQEPSCPEIKDCTYFQCLWRSLASEESCDGELIDNPAIQTSFFCKKLMSAKGKFDILVGNI